MVRDPVIALQINDPIVFLNDDASIFHHNAIGLRVASYRKLVHSAPGPDFWIFAFIKKYKNPVARTRLLDLCLYQKIQKSSSTGTEYPLWIAWALVTSQKV